MVISVFKISVSLDSWKFLDREVEADLNEDPTEN